MRAGPALKVAGRVIVAGCRDAAAARSLGFVPSHNLTTAIEMALGVAEDGRIGALVAPPYVPLVQASACSGVRRRRDLGRKRTPFSSG